MQFTHKISKGSTFNQIYVPRGMENYFEVGDLVEVKLLEKKIGLYYSKNLEKFGEFKEKLIKEIFSFLSRFEEINQIFIVGSFLTSKADYRDVDLVFVADKSDTENKPRLKSSRNILAVCSSVPPNPKQTSDFKLRYKPEGFDDDKIYEKLTEKFGMKFHVISMTEEKFLQLKKSCPLTRSMFYYCISNRAILDNGEREIDANHLKFLLMLPEDSLEINLSGRAYYDCLRRLIAIEKFLSNKEEDPKKINSETEKLIGKSLFLALKDNERIEGAALEKIKKIIIKKLNKIGKEIEDEQN